MMNGQRKYGKKKRKYGRCIQEYYSAIKKNETMSFAGEQIEPEIIMLSIISQTQKAKCCMFSLTCGTST
jgi:hypothetical protein